MSEIRSMAEIEKDNARLAKLKAENKAVQERYTHTILEDEGVVLDAETALKILRAVNPKCANVECARYYFINDRHSAALIGVDKDNVAMFTAEMPKEMADVVDDPLNLEMSVEYFKQQEQLFKEVNNKIRWFVWAALVIAVCILLNRSLSTVGNGVAIIIVIIVIALNFRKRW